MKALLQLSTFLLLNFTIAGCSLSGSVGSSESSPTGGAPTEGASDLFTKTTLSSSSYFDGTIHRPYDLIKTQTNSSNPTFMQWLPNENNTLAGAVLIYYPYEGIDWTGLALDSKWSSRSGLNEDEDAPFYQNGVSSQISYTLLDHNTAAGINMLFAMNKVHVLIVYGRFYSGADPRDDVQAVVDGLKFLHSQSTVDKSKIGVYSGSWGGLGVLHGVAAAGPSMQPKALSLAYPVSSPKDMVSYAASIPDLTADATKRSQYAAFFDPYLRRINKATESLAGQAQRYDNWTHAQLSSITSNIFVIHDEWDTLVPIEHTENLLTSIGSSSKIAYYQRHTSPINYTTFALSHAQAANPIDYTTSLTWTYAYLITELTSEDSPRAVVYSSANLISQFSYMKSMKDALQDTSNFNAVMGLLCRPYVFLQDLDNSYPLTSGSNLFFILMENLYQNGWAADGPAACAKLISQPPF